MTIIKPYQDFVAVCPMCNRACDVRVFNGIDDWVASPSVSGVAGPGVVMTVFMCSNAEAEEAVVLARREAPHFSDYLIVWCKDDAAYELVLKLLNNYTPENYDGTNEDEDDEGCSGKPAIH